MVNQIRVISGIVIWIFILGWIGFRCSNWFAGGDRSAAGQLGRFLFQPALTRDLKFVDTYATRIGEPIFWRNEEGNLIQIGMIRQIESPESRNHQAEYTDWASARFFSNAPELRPDHYLKLYDTPQTLAWVAEALLPDHKVRELTEHIDRVLESKAEFLSSQLKPVMLRVLGDTAALVIQALAESISAKADEWAALGRRYEEEIVNRELVPLINREVWPIIQEEMSPVIQSIGAEIWAQASVWSFGWRAMYDSLPLTNADLAQKEFERFVEQTALPTIAARTPDLMAAQQRVLARIVENPEIQEFVRVTFSRLASDAELRALIGSIIREAILENRQLHERLDAIWSSDDIRRVLRQADTEFGRDVTIIGEMLFGTPTGGVTPEFARILRHKILLKDMRWFLLTTLEQDPSDLVQAMPGLDRNTMAVVYDFHSGENPFFIEADKRK